MSDSAKLKLGNTEVDLPIHVGTEGNRAIDISKLLPQTGHITLDDGYGNTGSCVSRVTFVDGENGILRYRGYPVEELAERCDFTETSYLLIYGELPSADQLEEFRTNIRVHTLLHEGMRTIYSGFPPDAHPMAILSSVVGALAIYCKDSINPRDLLEAELAIYRMLAKMPTIAAFSYKQSIGQPFIYPDNTLTYCQNFLQMMFAVPSERYHMDPDFVDALNLVLILHADHGQNCSTSAVRMVGSSTVNLFSSISAGICALWGALHGGANEACINMLEAIRAGGGGLGKYIDRAKDPNDEFRLMGFGHRVYKNYDPRAKVIKEVCHKLMAKHKLADPIFDLGPRVGGSGPQRSVFRGSQALSERRFLFRNHLPDYRHPQEHVHRAFRPGPLARLDRPIGGRCTTPPTCESTAPANSTWAAPNASTCR